MKPMLSVLPRKSQKGLFNITNVMGGSHAKLMSESCNLTTPYTIEEVRCILLLDAGSSVSL